MDIITTLAMVQAIVNAKLKIGISRVRTGLGNSHFTIVLERGLGGAGINERSF